jgi:DNA-binding transcriptional ArsR family regulator
METRRDVFQAIADPTRRGILAMLATKPQNLNSIADQFSMTRQAVSLHVKVLTECGVVTIHQDGRERFCHVELEKLAEVQEWLEPFRILWDNRFNQLDSLLRIMNTNDNDIPE